MDEERKPWTTAKFVARKGKALVVAATLEANVEIKKEEEEDKEDK